MDRSNPDQELRDCVMTLLMLWDDIRWLYRELPKPENVGPMNLRWATSSPTRIIIPKLITRAAMQPIAADVRVLIMHGVSAWAEAYNQLIAIAALDRIDRHPDSYLAAIEEMNECAENLRLAAKAIRRNSKWRRMWRIG